MCIYNLLIYNPVQSIFMFTIYTAYCLFLGIPVEGDVSQKRQRRVLRSQILRQMALGAKEGSDWKLLREQARAKAMAQENHNNSGMNDGIVCFSCCSNCNMILSN